MAWSQTIFSCTDASGGKVYSTSRDFANCRPVNKTVDNTVSGSVGSKPKASSNPTPADFPRVQEGTQKARDTDRRHILEQELAGEQRNLEQARRELAQQVGLKLPLERLTPYRDRVAQHERNISALQKELSSLR